VESYQLSAFSFQLLYQRCEHSLHFRGVMGVQRRKLSAFSFCISAVSIFFTSMVSWARMPALMALIADSR
jgi:hypothetical protein